ncbi:hypothetical protein LINPERHAP1_LOCUS31658 [Linum perenne]
MEQMIFFLHVVVMLQHYMDFFYDMVELTCLEKLKIQCGRVGMEDQRNFQGMQPVEKVCRESIKVVEIIDFNGYEIECEFIKYVFKYFTGLEKIIIDGGFSRDMEVNLEEIRKCALGLKSLAHPRVEFVPSMIYVIKEK